MSLANQILTINDDFFIRTHQPVHRGKVRAVYWLTKEDSQRLAKEKNYDVASDALLAVMVISDRISAFDCIWKADGGLNGVPGKGAALNAIANYWFKLFKANSLTDSHILDIPHPYVWIVQKAKPVKIEAICRKYITGSMWRAYAKGARKFCGITLPEGLKKDSALSELFITPSTKGILTGIPGVPETDDVNITRKNIEDNFAAFNFSTVDDIAQYETCLKEGFSVISNALAEMEQIFVDTKFEFGYVTDTSGKEKLIYIDEVGTPDSSRIWDTAEYKVGNIVENSKEDFRQFLLNYFSDPDILLNKNRMSERKSLALNNTLPVDALMNISKTYIKIAEKIIGQPIHLSDNPKQEIIDILKTEYNLYPINLNVPV
ncbi:phosphoribosylaminoimidazolesuccinocarboxamide synthase [Candidatus Enterovibrio altilux]|nr:phosphoribosylaminoimidazolesuccinocarboxamide synthase [Candidatus Enterovibrio luxaltus]